MKVKFALELKHQNQWITSEFISESLIDISLKIKELNLIPGQYRISQRFETVTNKYKRGCCS